MAKIPKLSEFTNIQGILEKAKTAIDNLMGPGTAEITSEAIEKETDPVKTKLLEVELLINQLHDIQLIQAKTIHALKAKYVGIKKLIETIPVVKSPELEKTEKVTDDSSIGEKSPPIKATNKKHNPKESKKESV